MGARTVVIDWPAGEGIEIRADNEPYLAGTDFPIRIVRGFSLPEQRETIDWLREEYGDILTDAQLATVVAYYSEHEFIFMVDDDWP